MTYKIFVIDDEREQAGNVVKALNAYAERKNADEIQFEFERLPGQNPEKFMNKEYDFYDETVVAEIENACAEVQGDGAKAGLLLDILLSKEDLEKSMNAYYPNAGIAKKIYYTFYERIPVYLITSFAAFATQCEMIMGENLSDKFITHNAILWYKINEDIDKMFDFYKNGI